MRKKKKAKVKIKTSRVTKKRPVGRKKSAVVVKKKRRKLASKKFANQETAGGVIFDSNKGLTDSLFVADEKDNKNSATGENDITVFATSDVVKIDPEEIIGSMPDIDQKNKQEREKGILEKIFSFAKYSFRNLFSSILMGLVFAGLFSAIFYALALPYAPGETTNPTCSPGDTNCTVTAAVPYTGATAAVDLGAKNFATTGTGSFAGLTLTTSALTVGNGGIGLSTIAAGSILGANTLDTLTAITSTSGTKYLKNASGTISWDSIDLSAYVPYTGATGTVALGANTLSTTSGLISPKLYPAADSTTAVQILKADGTTNVLNVDTTNARVGIGTTGPAYKLELAGTSSVADRTLGINATPVIYLLDQAVFPYSLALGDGLRSSVHVSGLDGLYNLAVGIGALVSNTTGYQNSATGAYALFSDTSGYYNTADGYAALYQTNSGYENVGIGRYALGENTTGYQNTAVGKHAGYNGSLLLQTLNNSTFLGYGANSSVNAITNSMALGSTAQVTKSNQVVIGNTSVTETLLNGNVGIGTTGPTAYLHLKAGTATASTAPLKLTSGTNLTAAEAGAIEFDGTNLYYTDSTPTRQTLATSTGAANTALSNLASVAVNTSLISDTDSTDDLGSTTKQWANLYTDNIKSSTATDLTIENDGSDQDIIFKVNDGGVDTTVMTLDGATSNVGIGTMSPGAKLHVAGNILLDNTDSITIGDSTDNLVLKNRVEAWPATAGLSVTSNVGAYPFNGYGNLLITPRDTSDILFGDFSGPVVTIKGDGNVGIGTATPTGHLQIDGNISASAWTTDGISFDSNAATYTDTSTAAAGTVATRTANSFGAPTFASTNAITVTDAFTLYAPKPVAGTNTTITRTNSAYFEGAVMLGAVAANNGFSTGSLGDGSTTMYIGNSTINVTAPSDIITKENISSTKFGISQLMQFSVKDFLYKEEYVKEKGGQKQHTGMIAQEVEEIYPDAMIYRSDNLKAIDYNKLIPLIIKSIQDLKLGGLTSNGAVGSGQVSGVQSSYIGSQIKEGLLALGASINKGIATVEEIVAQKLNVKTARTQNLEMVDSETGEIYCAWIAGGEWQKAKGECGSVVATTDKSEILNPIEPKGSPRSVQSETNSNVQNSNAENETTESGDVGLPAGSPTSGASSGEIGSLPASSEQAQEVVQQAAQAAQAAQQAASNALETVENAQQAIQEQVQEVVQHAAETADQTAKKAVKEMKEEIKEEVKQELKEEKAAEQSGETRSPENLNADSVEVGSPPASAGEQSVAEPVAEPVFEPPANSVSEIIQDAAAGLINAVQDFIKSIFKTGFEKVSSLPIIKNATAGISAPMNNLWQIIIKLF